MLSPEMRSLLLAYNKKGMPGILVLEEQRSEAYYEKEIQKVVHLASKKACLTTQVTPHCLHHSFAAHFLENGTDVHYVQKLLGHTLIKTTENYTLKQMSPI